MAVLTYQVDVLDVRPGFLREFISNHILSHSVSAPENSPPAPESHSNPSAVGETPADAAAQATTPAADTAASLQSAPAQSPDEFDDYEPLTPEIVEEEAIRGDFVLRWAVVLLAFLLGSTHIVETPTLVHVKTGQYLLTHGILPPRNDVFSYTALERPWANLSWGFDLLTAGLHAIGQFTALSLAKAIVIAVAFWLIGRISRPGTSTWWGSICGVLAMLGCHLRMSAQPTIVTLLGLALVMW